MLPKTNGLLSSEGITVNSNLLMPFTITVSTRNGTKWDPLRFTCIIEMIGEWNDALHNDIMYLKRNVIEILMENGINKFILIGENVLNFHSDDQDYYQEWFDEIEEGWIVGLNFREHVINEFRDCNLDYYIAFGGRFNEFSWRTDDPHQLFLKIEGMIMKRLNP